MSAHISSIALAWRYVLALGAGLGFATLARWFWWRVNAWTEIAGMSSALLCCLLIPSFLPGILPDHLMLYSAGISTAISLLVIFITRNNKKQKHLVNFVNKIQPVGFWGKYHNKKQAKAAVIGFWQGLKAWLMGSLGIYGLLFGLGFLLFQNYLLAILGFIIGVYGLKVVLKQQTKG